jgi:hypothetical protein
MNEVRRAVPNESRILAIIFMPVSSKTMSIPTATAKLMMVCSIYVPIKCLTLERCLTIDIQFV